MNISSFQFRFNSSNHLCARRFSLFKPTESGIVPGILNKDKEPRGICVHLWQKKVSVLDLGWSEVFEQFLDGRQAALGAFFPFGNPERNGMRVIG